MLEKRTIASCCAKRSGTVSLAIALALAPMWASAAPPQQVAQASAESGALQRIVEGAKGEGGVLSIVNYSLAHPTFVNGVSEGMSKRYGIPIRINIVPGPTPSALARQLAKEYEAGRHAASDVFVGDDVNSMVQLKANALLSLDRNALAKGLPDEAMGPENSFVRYASRAIGSVWYNTNLVPADKVPKSLNDVLDPMWKGRVASTTFIAGFREAAGLYGKKQEMIDFLNAFRSSGNLAGFIRGSATERIATGEFALMVFGPGGYAVTEIQQKGAPVDYTIFPEVPYISFWTVSVPKHSARPNLAKLFAHYMTTREGQDFHYKTQWFDLHYLEGSQTAKDLAKAFKNVKPVTITNDVLISKWDEYARVTPVLSKAIRGSR